MMSTYTARRFSALVMVLGLAIAGTAQAAVQTIAAPGGVSLLPGPLTLSGQLASNGSSTAGALATGADETLTLPGSYTYGDSFVAPVGTTALAGSSTGSGFHDAYAFTVGSSSATSVTTTIKLSNILGINGLFVRLYGANPGDLMPVLGNPATYGTAGAYFEATTTSLPLGLGEVAVLDAVTLAAGTYVLEVRGLVTGSAGGSYSGVLDLAPVPLPAGLPLLLSGAGALAGFLRRRAPAGVTCIGAAA